MLLVGAVQVQKQDIEKEKQAIMAVMEEESAAWYASDPERFAATYLNDEDFTTVNASKGSCGVQTGWKERMERSTISTKRQLIKEKKTPITIKVYPETAWVVFRNEGLNENGETTSINIVTTFLEKVNGKWKTAYRSQINQGSYYQHELWILAAIRQARALGKSPEEAGNLAGDMFKATWNKAGGYATFVNNTKYNWSNVCAPEELKVIEQDENHAVFTVNKIFSNLRRAGQAYEVSYDDYLAYYKGLFDTLADYMGGTYKQESIPEGVEIHISKK
jgi:hypothetical protein